MFDFGFEFDLGFPIEWLLGGVAAVILLVVVLRSRNKKGGSSGGDFPEFIKQAKWFGVPDLSVPPATIEGFLDFIKSVGCNSVLVKVGQWPLMGFNPDGSPQIDGAWLERLRWFIQQCDRRQIWCQECWFDVFDKAAGTPPTANKWVKDPNRHLLHYGKNDERWEPYLKLLAEELLMPYRHTFIDCNEVDADGRGEMFAENYNKFLKPILDRHAPGKLVGVSENNAFNAQTHLKQPHNYNFVQAGHFINEHASSSKTDSGEPPWDDPAIRNPGNRDWYRRVNQEMRQRGAKGTCACSWLRLDIPLNEAAKGALKDLGSIQ